MTGSPTVRRHATAGPDLEFRLLGPVEARVRGVSLDLGGSKPYGVLAMLLLSANRAVPVGTLIDGLWAEDAPRTAAKMIQIYVSRIRHHLVDKDGCLHTTPGGYLLRVDDEALDLLRFNALTERARGVAEDDPAAAAQLLREALDLWQGDALANVRNEPFAVAAVARLDEQRLSAIEARIDADLAVGRHRAVIAELQHLVASHPTREHLGAQLMLALYRSGRQAEALAAAKRLRTSLDADLGISPGPAIAALEVAILRQEPSLDPPPSARQVEQPSGQRQPLVPAGDRRRRRRWRWSVGISAVAIAAISALIASNAGSAPRNAGGGASGAGVAIKPASLLLVDGGRDAVLADVPLGGQPDRIAIAGDSAWVSNQNLQTVTRIDLATHTVGETVGLADWPSNIAASDADVWIGNGFRGTVTRLFTSTDQVTAPSYPDGQHAGLVVLATDGSRLYAGLPDGRLVALAVSNLRVAVQTRLRDRVAVLSESGSTLCAGYFRASAVDCLRTPRLSVRATMLLPTTALAITCTDDNAWALAGAPAGIWHLDLAEGGAPTRLNIPGGATAIAATPDYLWVLYGESGRLLRLPVRGPGPAVTLDIGRRAAQLATWHDDVIVSVT